MQPDFPIPQDRRSPISLPALTFVSVRRGGSRQTEADVLRSQIFAENAMANRTSTETDPRHGGEKPPFDEPSQAPPGLETEMRTKPDHGEQSYTGYGRLRNKFALITGGDSGI